MTITKSITESGTTLKMEGWLDTLAAADFEGELKNVENKGELTLDMTELEYISSSGVRQVVAAYKMMDGKLDIKGAPENILNVFKSIGIDKKVTFV